METRLITIKNATKMTVNVIKEQELLGKNIKVYGTIENPLFLAKDVAEWIGHTNITMMINSVEEDERLIARTKDCLGRDNGANFLTENGLYEVLMLSRKPIAKQFKKGVKEILKDIRQNGFYANSNTVEKFLNDPDNMIKILQEYKEKKEQLEIAQNQLALQAPKVEYYDALVDRNGLSNLRDTAKTLGFAPQAFVNMLLENEFLFRDKKGRLRPYAQHIDLFTLKEWKSQNGNKADFQTLVNQKGREKFLKIFKSQK